MSFAPRPQSSKKKKGVTSGGTTTSVGNNRDHRKKCPSISHNKQRPSALVTHGGFEAENTADKFAGTANTVATNLSFTRNSTATPTPVLSPKARHRAAAAAHESRLPSNIRALLQGIRTLEEQLKIPQRALSSSDGAALVRYKDALVTHRTATLNTLRRIAARERVVHHINHNGLVPDAIQLHREYTTLVRESLQAWRQSGCDVWPEHTGDGGDDASTSCRRKFQYKNDPDYELTMTEVERSIQQRTDAKARKIADDALQARRQQEQERARLRATMEAAADALTTGGNTLESKWQQFLPELRMLQRATKRFTSQRLLTYRREQRRAAVRIQRFYRKYLSLRQIQDSPGAMATVLQLQAWWRGRRDYVVVQAMLRNVRACIRIQSMFRAYVARRHYRLEMATLTLRHKAASTVQRCARTHLRRKQLRERIRRKHWYAGAIQALYSRHRHRDRIDTSSAVDCGTDSYDGPDYGSIVVSGASGQQESVLHHQGPGGRRSSMATSDATEFVSTYRGTEELIASLRRLSKDDFPSLRTDPKERSHYGEEEAFYKEDTSQLANIKIDEAGMLRHDFFGIDAIYTPNGVYAPVQAGGGGQECGSPRVSRRPSEATPASPSSPNPEVLGSARRGPRITVATVSPCRSLTVTVLKPKQESLPCTPERRRVLADGRFDTESDKWSGCGSPFTVVWRGDVEAAGVVQRAWRSSCARRELQTRRVADAAANRRAMEENYLRATTTAMQSCLRQQQSRAVFVSQFVARYTSACRVLQRWWRRRVRKDRSNLSAAATDHGAVDVLGRSRPRLVPVGGRARAGPVSFVRPSADFPFFRAALVIVAAIKFVAGLRQMKRRRMRAATTIIRCITLVVYRKRKVKAAAEAQQKANMEQQNKSLEGEAASCIQYTFKGHVHRRHATEKMERQRLSPRLTSTGTHQP